VANARATVERTGYAEVEKYLDEREKQVKTNCLLLFEKNYKIKKNKSFQKADREIRAARRTFTAQIREMSKEMMDQFDEARLHLSQHVDKQISDIDSMLELLHIVKEN
jgi:hypothetical protein